MTAAHGGGQRSAGRARPHVGHLRRPGNALGFAGGALVLAGTLLVSSALLGESPSAAQVTGDPMATYNPFNVVTFGTTSIGAESEGPVAVGGNLTFANTQIDFTPAAGSSSTSLLVQGLVNFGASSGQLKVLESSGTTQVHIGNLSGAQAINTDMNGASISLQIVVAGAQANSSPAVTTVNDTQTPASVSQLPSFTTALFDQGAAEQSATEVAADAGPTCNAGEVVSPPITSGVVTIPMNASGPTYWVVSDTDLSSLTEMNFSGPAPSPANPLIVVVNGTGPVTMQMNQTGGPNPSGILFAMPDVTSITQTQTLDGSILAPLSGYTKTGGNLQGTLVAASAVLGGSEEHSFPFLGALDGCQTTTTTAEPTTTTSSSTTTTTAEPTTTTSSSTTTTSLPAAESSTTTSLPTTSGASSNGGDGTSIGATSLQPVTLGLTETETSGSGTNQLASTGMEARGMVLLGLCLLAGGLTLLGASRLRSMREREQ